MYVHIPKYESRGASTVFVVNRCLFGLLVMQLTMMGLLALRAGEGSNAGAEFEGLVNGDNTGYLQMVLGIAPLIVITVVVYFMLKHAYERQIRNTPIDIVCAADKAAARELPEADPSGVRQELELSTLFGISVQNESIMNFEQDESFRIPVNLQEIEAQSTSLEPPMTRINGILDVPLDATLHSTDCDALIGTYIHPACIGKLPIAWISGPSPPRLTDLRNEQSRIQRESLSRYVARQKAGAHASSELAQNLSDQARTHNLFDGFVRSFSIFNII